MCCCCRSHPRYVPPPQMNVFAEIELDEKKDGAEDERPMLDLNSEFTYAELSSKVFIVDVTRPVDVLFDTTMGPVIGRLQYCQPTADPLGNAMLQLNLIVIKTIGTTFYRSMVYPSVSSYKGKLRLCDLDVRPAMPEEIVALRERGRKFSKYALGCHYMYNSGKMFSAGWGGFSKFSGEGRVMVDTATFMHFNPNYGPLAEGYGLTANQYQISVRGAKHGAANEKVPETSLHLCWPTLCGFSFKMKRWGEILVENMEPIKFREDSFDKLVMDTKLKMLMKSLVENYGSGFNDIISGKGGGCIFLLHGPPGVGKTLTAEAISEFLHRPLYMIDVGELGITPMDLESKLRQVLEVAEKWNAVVLIDEADIFLEARSKSDVLRNSLVGVFLRLLEYHNGVLFLTSNRVEEIDQAFQSRISVSLNYKELDRTSRQQVWENLLDSAEIKERDSDQLSEFIMNGRQIKTAIRLAMSLAVAEKSDVTMPTLLESIAMCRSFLSQAVFTARKKSEPDESK